MSLLSKRRVGRTSGAGARPGWRLVGVLLIIVVAGLIGVVLYQVATSGPTYNIDPLSVVLTSQDVGSGFQVLGTVGVGPTQMSAFPEPYQQQFLNGLSRSFRARDALTSPGLQQLIQWNEEYGIHVGTEVSEPIIMGPFVTDHAGIFEIFDVVRSYRTTDSAHQDYACCHYVGREQSFDNYRTFHVTLGDEADGWTGIEKAPSGTTVSSNIPTSSSLQELGYVIHWRKGPIVSLLSIWGAHDITLDDALSLARIADTHVAAAMRQSGKADLHAHGYLILIAGTPGIWEALPPRLSGDSGSERARLQRSARSGDRNNVYAAFICRCLISRLRCELGVRRL